MIEYVKDKTAGTARYDAKVGHLHVGVQDNGERWWNWWIAVDAQGICAGDGDTLEEGGAPTLRAAKAAIDAHVELIARRILSDLLEVKP